MRMAAGCGSTIEGFDMSYMNVYRWHPDAEARDLASTADPWRPLSAPFDACTLDFQSRLEAQGAERAGDPESIWELDVEKEVEITAPGIWNAVVYWFELDLDDHTRLVSYPDEARAGTSGARPFAATSYKQAVQYLDELPATLGATLKLRIRQDNAQIIFSSSPPPTRPRQAYLPRWQLDALHDDQRTQAYATAVRRAVASKRADGVQEIMALDIGCGAALQSMLAARAGAHKVVGIEQSMHLCEVGEECAVMNGLLQQCTLLNRDSRRVLSTDSPGVKKGRKPDGNVCELDRQADILIYQIFDSGLLGEGCLHHISMAKMRLLKEDAQILPLGATVFAQPIQMRIAEVQGFDLQSVNRYRWRSGYEGIELGECREQWKALAEPLEVFSFEFGDVEANVAPLAHAVEFDITQDGIFNAIAFWFELQIDEETTLSTSPYGKKGPTWTQAVQYFEELQVARNSALPVTAKHDTYSISFEVDDSQVDRLASRTGVPLYDPVWHATYQRLEQFNSSLIRSTVQNPLEYRSCAETSVAIGARPRDLDLDVQPATDFCMRMMG
ncbi:hypothetical protein CYMTET_23176 [Cymbomonas tetramitiformis]|uniref:Protein arginine N-methyltransferase domain-containing protein n=1 Tax=Cymbomonas tetramitiformis TaxID=36881 RepID=A0AAE0FYE7_9CHLO|nr:hypothetical protein CYMTET_23176 [Cymbomonas tetramitiformis]